MTVSEVSRNLFNFFSTNDIFFLEKDFLNVVTVTGNDKEVDKQVVAHALKGFEAQGIALPIKEHSDSSESSPVIAWVLVKPLAEYSQNIEITFPTITAIANIINEFCDANNLEKDRVNPLNVTEQDVQNLILVYSTLKNRVEELDKE